MFSLTENSPQTQCINSKKKFHKETIWFKSKVGCHSFCHYHYDIDTLQAIRPSPLIIYLYKMSETASNIYMSETTSKLQGSYHYVTLLVLNVNPWSECLFECAHIIIVSQHQPMYVYKNKNVKQENIQVNISTPHSYALRKLLPWRVLWRQLIGNIGWFPRMVSNYKAQRMQHF